MIKLDERIKQYDIPEIPYLPIHKDVLVFRMPDEEKTKGGLFVPKTTSEPKSYGVIVAAGLGALDVMYSNLIELGDIVWFGTFEGEEKEISREVGSGGKKLLQMKIEGIRGSVDAVDRSKGFDVVRNADGEHMYQPKARKKVA
jgi:chaperonin GroES